jgi:gamma-glutamyl phosphate reductase
MLHERLGAAGVERFKKFVAEIKEIPVIEESRGTIHLRYVDVQCEASKVGR